MAGKQLVKMWEHIGGDENVLKASEMREQCGMKQIIVQARAHAACLHTLLVSIL